MNAYGRRLEIGKLFGFVAGKGRTRRTEAKAGSGGCVDPLINLGLRGMEGNCQINLFLMQVEFTDDVGSGQCLQLGGMNVRRRNEEVHFSR